MDASDAGILVASFIDASFGAGFWFSSASLGLVARSRAVFDRLDAAASAVVFCGFRSLYSGFFLFCAFASLFEKEKRLIGAGFDSASR